MSESMRSLNDVIVRLDELDAQFVHQRDNTFATMAEVVRCAKACVDGVTASGRQGFVTSESCGLEGRYEVVAKFKTLKEMQRFYQALASLGALKTDD